MEPKKYVKVNKNIRMKNYRGGDIVELTEANKFWVRDKIATEYFVKPAAQVVTLTPEMPTLLAGPEMPVAKEEKKK